MRRGMRIRESRLKGFEELDHLVPAAQDPRLRPGWRQSILELIGKRGVSGLDVALVPGSISLLETRSERAKELGLHGWHRPRSISRESCAFHAKPNRSALDEDPSRAAREAQGV